MLFRKYGHIYFYRLSTVFFKKRNLPLLFLTCCFNKYLSINIILFVCLAIEQGVSRFNHKHDSFRTSVYQTEKFILKCLFFLRSIKSECRLLLVVFHLLLNRFIVICFNYIFNKLLFFSMTGHNKRKERKK